MIKQFIDSLTNIQIISQSAIRHLTPRDDIRWIMTNVDSIIQGVYIDVIE